MKRVGKKLPVLGWVDVPAGVWRGLPAVKAVHAVAIAVPWCTGLDIVPVNRHGGG